MNKLSKEKQQQLIAVAMVTILAIVGIWFGLISMQKKKNAGLAKQSKDMKEKVESAEATVKKNPAIEEQLNEDTRQVKSIEEKMASGDLYAWMITTIDNFIKRPEAGYKVEVLGVSKEQLGDAGVLPGFTYKAATSQIKGNAYFHDFGKFITDLENGFPYFRVQNLELAPSSVGPEKLDFKFELVVLVKP